MTTEQAGRTLADLLRASVPGTSWNKARELCKRGKVSVNGQRATDAAVRLRPGDELTLAPHAPRLRHNDLDPSAVVYVDAHVVVVNKPAGLLTVPFDEGEKNTLADRVRMHLRRTTGRQGAELGVVQRLDKDTTGLLVFARTLAAKRHLAGQLRAHSIERSYLALVHGELREAATYESDLVRDRGDGLRGSFGVFRRPRGPLPGDAQHAVTHVRPLQRLRGATLVQCRLHTGRQHQIRIHLSEHGHPLVGEPVYLRDYHGTLLPAPRPMLHAETLGFVHPATDRPMRFSQPPPEDFAALHRQRS